MQVPGDDIGALHNTIVTATLHGVHDLRPAVTRPYVPGQTPRTIRLAVDALNGVIEHYRVEADAPQIRRLPYVHARGASGVVHHDHGSRTSMSFLGGNGLRPTGDSAEARPADPTFTNVLQDRVLSGPPPQWRLLVADARAEIITGSLQTGLVHLYVATEMLANETCWRLGSLAASEQEVRAFLESDDAADTEPPSVTKRVKACRDWAVGGPTKTVLTRSVAKLFEYRNDILHGRDPEIPDSHPQQALVAFRSLAEWLLSAQPANADTSS